MQPIFLTSVLFGRWGRTSHASSVTLLTHMFFASFISVGLETKTGPYLPAVALQIHFKLVRGRSEQKKKAAWGAQTVKHLREEQTWPGNFSLKHSIRYILFNLSRHSRSLNTQRYRGRKRGCLDPTARHPWGVKLQIRRVFTSERASTPYTEAIFFSACVLSNDGITLQFQIGPRSRPWISCHWSSRGRTSSQRRNLTLDCTWHKISWFPPQCDIHTLQ